MKRVLSLILVLVMAAALLVCPAMAAGGNGGGGGGGNGGGNGESPLNVVSVTIGDKDLEGAVILPDGAIAVVFARGMNKNSEATAAAISIQDAECEVEFDGDRTFTVSFLGLSEGEHTLVIGADAKANNGNTLGKDYKVKFTVERSGEYYGEACPSEAFTDVDRSLGSWYHKAVDWAVTEEITKGTSDTTFSPNKPCTRAEAVTFLWRAAGEPKVTGASNPFQDVASNAYYYDAVLWAVDEGVTQGTAAGKFSPNDTCTREQIVTFLWRCDGEELVDVANPPFKDVTRSDYSFSAVLWAVDAGVTQGTSADEFSPKTPCTRAMIVTFLYRATV